ncbi:MAG: heme lyase CcmF/NrfE family subunit [Bacteroidia bacterium]
MISYNGENLWAGQLGHAAVLLSFVASVIALISYSFATIGKKDEINSWRKMGRTAFWLHGLGVLGIIVMLFFIIYNHLYEYHYAWSHASRELPVKYIISAFWEGQEGSFLLWTFWHLVIGLVLMYSARHWESPVMAVVTLAQVALSSMLLGTYILGYKVGSSPFILLREAMEAPIFANPDYLQFITDGNGLNPLLQNPWMVIHPPVLFLGFASTIVPFAFAIAGLIRADYKNWLIPALPWTLFAVMILGTGIMMGAAWAYESLNFGGYWAWDPVENASLIPWLTLIGAFHVMHAYKKTGNSLPTTFILVIISFVLILYATFLTRSGILGESSVHSFTDLGMSGQLLIFLFAFVFLGFGLMYHRWRDLPRSAKDEHTYSREFWLFIGTLILFLSAFQVFASTSIPVFNKLFGTNAAPPADPIAHYNRWQLPMAVLILMLTVIAQYMKYKKSDPKVFGRSLLFSGLIAAVLTAATVIPLQILAWPYVLLAFACWFSLTGNGDILRRQFKKLKSAGASVAHIGFALMMLGVLISSANKEVVSINQSGLSYGENFNPQQNHENVLLWKNEPLVMNDYRVTYLGDSIAAPNHYYKVHYERLNKQGEAAYSFTLYPNAQINPKMGLIANPDTKHYLWHDLYTHVTQVIDKDAYKDRPKWQSAQKLSMRGKGDTVMLSENLIILEGMSLNLPDHVADKVAGAEVAVAARILVRSIKGDHVLEPVYAIQNGAEFRYDASSEAAGLKVSLNKIDPIAETIEFMVAEATPGPKEYIIMKAIKFPFINVLWLGTIILVIGFSMAIMDRYFEAKRLEAREKIS